MWGEAIRHTINSLPGWLSILLTVLILTAPVLALFFVVRRFYPAALHEGNADILATTTKTTSLCYGFFLGFVMTVLWQTYNKANDIVTQEASHLTMLADNSYGLGPQDGARLRRDIAHYITAVREKEWPAMREGKSCPEAATALDNLLSDLESFSPMGDVALSAYTAITATAMNLYNDRKARLGLLESSISDVMRVFITLGYLIDVLLIALVYSQRKRMHLVLTALFGTMVAFNIGIAANLDFPFSGEVSISSDPLIQGNLASLESAS